MLPLLVIYLLAPRRVVGLVCIYVLVVIPLVPVARGRLLVGAWTAECVGEVVLLLWNVSILLWVRCFGCAAAIGLAVYCGPSSWIPCENSGQCRYLLLPAHDPADFFFEFPSYSYLSGHCDAISWRDLSRNMSRVLSDVLSDPTSD